VRRRFFWALVAVAVVTLAVGGLAAALLINHSVEESARSEFTRQAEATARLIEAGMRERGVGQAPLRNLGSILAVVAAVGGHDYVEAVFVGPGGGVTVVGEQAPVAAQIPGGAAALTARVQFEARVGGEAVAAFALPVPVGALGTVVVVIGTDLDLVPWPPVVVRLLWAVGLGVLLAALLAGWLSRFLGKRLDGLGEASRRVAAGDLRARVEVEGDDEIAQVGVAFNEMAGQLEQARRREREFLAAVGHDLRTPLTTIAGYAEALEEGKVAPGDLPRVSGVIHRESGRLSRLLEDLMLLSRLEAGEFSLRPEHVDLARHLGGSVEAYRGRAEAAGVALETDLAEVPEAMVDPDRIDQVVGNLVENALRYTPEGGRVRLTLRPAGSEARISVSDTGPGIEAADLPHIFERLYVARRYRPQRAEGSGLGLAIVKGLAEAMGGAAGVNSEPGGGTTVWVTVPGVPPGS
jgi:two-component system OmpR family sensor kinase